MQRLIPLLLLFAFCRYCSGQPVELHYPKTLHLQSDSFQVQFHPDPSKYPIKIDKRDTVDMGTDGSAGMVAVIYYDGKNGKDSVRIPYTHLPYMQVVYIFMQTPTQRVAYRLHFNGIISDFSKAYMEQHTGKTEFEVPEVYELANIIWTLSPTGRRATDLQKSGAYYKEVLAYFKPYINHPVFKQLDFPDSSYAAKYYDFRENSFTYSFNGDKIVDQGPYYYVTGNDWDCYTSTFSRLIPLIEDFAKKSNYKAFYIRHKALYNKQIQRESELMPIGSMWNWLETQFPPTKFQSYKVVFSPLIGGSHSTQNYTGYDYDHSKRFNETVMFVCNTDRYDTIPSYNDKQKEGLMSGVVFTEIDHNYINRVSNRYRKQIDSAFANKKLWSSDNKNWYSNPVAVFNEYLTHAVFCLWVMDTYDKPTADLVIKTREELMVCRRHFIRFKEFDQALIARRQQNRQKKVIELYPDILAWCKMQQ